MKLALGCDHGGFLLKEELKTYLTDKYEVVDFGCYDQSSVDYPVYAHKVANEVAQGNCEYGILICTTGVGMSISANKVKNARAVLATNEDICKMSREHNNANIICLGSKYTDFTTAKEYIKIFINTPFSEGERHIRRVKLIEEEK